MPRCQAGDPETGQRCMKSDTEFSVEADVECVVCPGCAFTFDRDHVDVHRDGYTCPECGRVGHIANYVGDET